LPICEYGNIIFMGASANHLHKLDSVQKMVERLCGTIFLSLASCYKASSIGLLCKLLYSQCRGPLQNFCPLIVSATDAYSFCYVTDDCLSLQQSIRYNSPDLFTNSFLGMISSIWAAIPLILIEGGIVEGWSAVCHSLQRYCLQLIIVYSFWLITIAYTHCMYAAIIYECALCLLS